MLPLITAINNNSTREFGRPRTPFEQVTPLLQTPILQRSSDSSYLMRRLPDYEQCRLTHEGAIDLHFGKYIESERMTAGNTNTVDARTYKSVSGFQVELVVRFPCVNANLHAVNREFEKLVLIAASEKISPKCLYINKLGLHCAERIFHQPLTQQNALTNLNKAKELLKKFHALDIADKSHTLTKQYKAWINSINSLYTKESLPKHFLAVSQKILELLDSEEIQSLPHSVCHLDLNTGNFLAEGEKLYLIDFETACYASPLFDVASLVRGFELNNDLEQQLVIEFKPTDMPEDKALLLYKKIKLIYALKPILWLLIQAKSKDQNANQCDYDFYIKKQLPILFKNLKNYAPKNICFLRYFLCY